MNAAGRSNGWKEFVRRETGADKELNRWKGFVLGVAGALVGLLLMRLYQQQLGPVLAGEVKDQGNQQESGQGNDDQGDGGQGQEKGEENGSEGQGQETGGQGNGGQGQEGQGETGPLDSISLIGKHHKEGESSTAALGRIFYHAFTGRDPSSETKTTLSYLVHWFYGMMMGGLFGAIRGGVRLPDLVGGLVFAALLWLFGDEMVVPLLGLQGGPTAASFIQHFNRLGAHLFYGAGLGVATQTLYFSHNWIRKKVGSEQER